MKKTLAFALLLVFLCTSVYAQTYFEKGYFITTEGNKVECLIKNEDWIGIPDKIEYKVDVNSTRNTVEKESLVKVHIENKLLLERHEVLIERYSKKLDELSETRIITPNKESLLLKVIANGKAKLLKYDFKGVQYFFYEINSEIKPLEYKLYKTSKGAVGKNLNYQKTLKENLSCPNSDLKSTIKYKEKLLVNYFTEYNSCFNSETKIYSQETEKGKFNVRGKFSIGISNSENPLNRTSEFSFKNKVIFKVGTELEYVFPFNNYKWSGFFEPTYQSYNGESKPFSQSSTIYEINYSSLELPFGVRHYSYINPENKIFFNAGVTLDWVLNDDFILNNVVSDFNEISTTINYFIGAGYELNNKISLEFRYNTARDLTKFQKVLGDEITEFNNISLKLGYNFL
jgi:hypothetical protein